MAFLNQQQMTSAGGAITLAPAAAGGDTAEIGSGRSFLWCKNGSGAAITVTLATPGTVDSDLAVADRTVTVPAAGDRLIGPLNPTVYGSIVSVTYSSVTSLTVAVVSI